MKTYTKTILLTTLLFSFFSNAQCDLIETITICDMTQIDNNNDGIPDGIINLYDEYFNLTGNTIQQGTWFDPGFNFAINEATGDLSLWDLDNASENVTDYQFELTNASCTTGVSLTLNLVLGPFSGYSVPTFGINEVNAEVCDIEVDLCVTMASYNLNQALLSIPSAHSNGIWSYEGISPNFVSLTPGGLFIADVPYQPGMPLVDEETFEFVYTVDGIAPCATSVETRVKISVIRDVFSGYANNINICEDEMSLGVYDTIDLTDDAFLVNEDIEGVWLHENDPTDQLSGPGDSVINLTEVYNDLIAANPRFGCQTYTYSYFVENRSAVCSDKVSDVTFTIYEDLRPFQQSPTIPEFCVGESGLSTLNLYDLLTFTTENGTLFDYPNSSCTNWSLISGPSNLGLISNNGIDICVPSTGYSSLGTIDLSNITNADAGTYVFSYYVAPEYNCQTVNSEIIYEQPLGCNVSINSLHPCTFETAQVTIVINPNLYAGENTGVLEFCEADISSPIDLIPLLETNGVDTVYVGAQGVWTNIDTGAIISDPFTLPEINNQTTFNFNYTTATINNCEDTANLSFIVYEQYQAGTGSTIEVCSDDANFNLFNILTGNPNTNGTWAGPNGFTSTINNVTFDPSTFDPGSYIYSVPDNNLCAGNEVTITVAIFQNANAGSNISESICRLNEAPLDLFTILDTAATPGGTFIDLDTTGNLNGSLLEVSELTAGTYNFEYQVQGNPICSVSTSLIEITILEVAPPVVDNQSFCISEGVTLNDIQFSNASDYNWYDSATSTTVLDLDTVLANNEDYFIAAVDANGCESARVQTIITLLPFGSQDCEDCINDGVSPNNDNENDNLDLCNLPEVFPNYEINVFNRYGTTVFKGNNNTPLFNGTSNVSLTVGNQLASGVYYYIFNPKDNVTAPFQGHFYLSR